MRHGTIIGFDRSGWAKVKWDYEKTFSYRIGQDHYYDIEII
jgi:hypothetical protein